MTYYVIGPDGNRYGPADLATLNQWAAQGRVTAQTLIEDETGLRSTAAAVPGLVVMPPPSMTPPTEPYGGSYPSYGPSPQYRHVNDGQSDVTGAWVLGTVGLFCCPIVFSTIGIVLASNAKNKGNPNAQPAFIYCIATLVIGMAFGILWAVATRGRGFSLD